MDAVANRVREDIRRFGWHVVKVMGDDDAPGWAYTIGLQETCGHPELAIFGMELEVMHELLNHAGALARAGRRFADGEEHAGIFEGLPCAFRAVQERWVDVFFGNAAWHYETSGVPLLQCFWPDPRGRFPWQADFDPAWRERQPLLYEREVERALSPRVAGTLRAEGALP